MIYILSEGSGGRSLAKILTTLMSHGQIYWDPYQNNDEWQHEVTGQDHIVLVDAGLKDGIEKTIEIRAKWNVRRGFIHLISCEKSEGYPFSPFHIYPETHILRRNPFPLAEFLSFIFERKDGFVSARDYKYYFKHMMLVRIGGKNVTEISSDIDHEIKYIKDETYPALDCLKHFKSVKGCLAALWWGGNIRDKSMEELELLLNVSDEDIVEDRVRIIALLDKWISSII
ncbi:hypothetical protein ACFL03_07910 [Thermodesulfobacteriota bacterium]